jgi:tetratricopeptide (TPR) repeat protein
LADAMSLTADDRDELVAAALDTAPNPATTASPTLPRQLPAAAPGFTGRNAELDLLDQAIGATPADETATGPTSTVVITAIAGAGGIGKTQLALRWAHLNADRFPDGHLFVDLRGFSPSSGPLDPLTAVQGFLDALGVDNRQHAGSLADHTALYRSVMAGRRMLIVLDNAASDGQVEPLLPGSPHCTTLITSRRRLTTLAARYTARHLSLTVLNDDEAHTLLAQRLGHQRVAAEPGAAAELITSCGRYPLALAIMASRAHAHPDIPLAEFTAELRESGLDALNDGDPGASLPAVLSLSLRDLTEPQREIFALLGIAPGLDIGMPAAVSLTGMPMPEVRAALRALVDASLLDRKVHERYTMHDLLREYAVTTARRDLTEDVRNTALRRAVDFYLHTAHAAGRILEPHHHWGDLGPPSPGAQPLRLADCSAALAWFDAEHRNLMRAQHVAVARGWHQIVWQLASILSGFHTRRGHCRDELTAWQNALHAAAHLHDLARHRAHRFLGRAYADLGRHPEAIEHLQQALTLAERHNIPSAQAHTHRGLALAWGRAGDDRRALEHATRALDVLHHLDQPVWKARALSLMGWFAARIGDYAAARDYCQVALTLSDGADLDGEAATLDNLGYIAHRAGENLDAVRYHRLALELYRRRGHDYHAADVLDNLGHPYAALSQHDQAEAVWREALELYRQHGRVEDADRVRRQLDALDHSDGR